jgi:hypothetical protein
MNEQMMLEHQAMMKLVSSNAATHQTVKSGDWSDPETWDKSIPNQGARIIINEGHTVTIHRELTPTFMTIKIEGKLAFSTDENTLLKADTIISTPKGIFEMGTRNNPIKGNVTAKIIIDDLNNGFETTNIGSVDYDPWLLGQGLIIMGHGSFAGTPKTSYATIKASKAPMAGHDRLELEHRPSDWEIGDTLVIAGTGFDEENNGQVDYNGDEVRTIVRIDQGKITLDRPLEKNHRLPRHSKLDLTLKVYVANLTRNVIVETMEGKRTTLPGPEGWVCVYKRRFIGGKKVAQSMESPEAACQLASHNCNLWYEKINPNNTQNDCYNAAPHNMGLYGTKTRGHVMFMHTNFLDINYAAFNHLGRTAKLIPLDDTTVDDSGNIDNIGTNNRARYSVHFHRAGSFANPGLVKGSVVAYGSGWGFVNHGSFAHMSDNVAYDLPGAGFVAERGDERGSFINNLAIKLHGTGDPSLSFHPRDKIEDHGYGGHGFWLQSPLLEIRDNVVIQAHSNAYGVWFKEFDGVSLIPYEYMPPHIRKNYVTGDSVTPTETPINIFKGNKAYGVRAGIGIGVTHPQRGHVEEFSIYEDTLIVNTNILVETTYSSGHLFKNLIGINNIESPFGTGLMVGENFDHYQLHNGHIEGFIIGIRPPQLDYENIVKDSYFNNVINIFVGRRTVRRHLMLHLINNTFGNLPPEGLAKGLERLNNWNNVGMNGSGQTARIELNQPTKMKGGSIKVEKIHFDKQLDYAFVSDKAMTQFWPFLQFLPVEIILEKDGQFYQVFFKKDQHPDYIPWPTEWVKSRPEDLNRSHGWRYWELAEFFRDKSNEELVAYSKANRESIFAWIKKTFSRGIDHHAAIRKINPNFIRHWPNWQWAMNGGELLPRNWENDPNYIDGDSMRMYNAVLKKVDKKKYVPEPLVAVDDVIDLTQRWIKNEDGSYTIKSHLLSALILSNDQYSGRDSLKIMKIESRTKNGGRFETYNMTGELVGDGSNHKRVKINPTYFPPADFKGKDSFEVIVGEADLGQRSKSTVLLTLGAEATPKNPVANPDNLTVKNGKSVMVDVLANDTHPEGKALSLQSVEDVYLGKASISGDTVSYTAPKTYVGNTTFGYTVTDSDGGAARGLVTVNIEKSDDYGEAKPPKDEEEILPEVPVKPLPEKDPPVLAVDDEAWFLWSTDTEKNKVKINVLNNDVGKRKKILSFTPPKYGKIVPKKNKRGQMKRLTYVQTKDYIGKDYFTYVMEDKFGNQSGATVTVEIKGDDDLNFPNGF